MTVDEYNICVDEYSDNIFRFILKNLNDESKSKDIVQDTYEKLWIKCDAVSFHKAKSYLFTTAYHTMIDYIRKDKKNTAIENIDYDTFSYTDEFTDIQEILHKAIKKLPHIQRSVLLLRDYEGYSYKEIEKITGLQESQVKVYIYRARMFLKKYIGSIETIV